MKLIECGVLMILSLGLILVFADKGVAQNVNNAQTDRVIYEQPMSYDDVLKMKVKAEQREKELNEKNSRDVNPLLDAVSNSSDQNPSMLIMMKALLNAMGIDELPEGIILPEDSQLSEEKQQQNRDSNNFKQWENRHNWKGLSTEQR